MLGPFRCLALGSFMDCSRKQADAIAGKDHSWVWDSRQKYPEQKCSPARFCLQLEPLRMVSVIPGRAGEEAVPRGPSIQEVPSGHIRCQEMGLQPHSDTWWPQERASLPPLENEDTTPLAGLEVCSSWTLAPGDPVRTAASRVTLGSSLPYALVSHAGSQDELSLPGMLSVRIK